MCLSFLPGGIRALLEQRWAGEGRPARRQLI